MILITKQKNKILGLVILLILCFNFFFFTCPVLAQAADPYGLDTTAGAAKLQKTDIKVVVGQVLKNVLIYLGIALLLLMVYGGVLWMISAGEEDKIKKAKQIITAAVVGVLIVVLAYTITSFIITRFTELGNKPSSGGELEEPAT